MIIREIALHNFGIYKGKQNVTLGPTAPSKPIILFGGQNGAGKTTLLDALQLALYGRAARCSNRGSLPYEEFLRQSIHRSVDPKEGASLEIEFTNTEQGQINHYRLRRIWAQNGKGIREYLEVMRNDSLDRVLSQNWLEYMEQQMPSKISHLFFFDGEKIEEFADVNNSAHLLSTAVRALLGVDIIDQLSSDLVVFSRRQRTVLKESPIKDEIEYYQTELESLEKRKSDLRQTRASHKNQKEQFRKKLLELDTRFRQEGGELFELRHQIEAEKVNFEKQLTKLEEQMRDIAAGPAPLFIILDRLQALERQAEREQVANQAYLLNEALSQRDRALIEKAIQEKLPDETVLIFKSFLESDRASRLKEADIHRYLNLSSDTVVVLRNLREHVYIETDLLINRILTKTEELRALLEDTDRKIAGIPNEELISHLILERDKLNLHIRETQSKMAIIDEELEHLDREYLRKHAQMVSRIEKAVEADFEHESRLRIIHHSQRTQEKLELFRSSLITANVGRIALLVREGFGQLLQKQSLIKALTINPQTFMLELQGWDGNPLPTERLSAGERQLLAVAILWGLARASGRPLPAAIDTPLGRLDSLHRDHLIERYFPYASHQVLLFSTDEEINEKYFMRLRPFVDRSYILRYDDSTGSSHIGSGYYW